MFKQSIDVMRKMMEDRQEEFRKIREMVEEVKKTDFYYKRYDKAMSKLIEALERMMDRVMDMNIRLNKVEERQEYTSKEIIELLAKSSEVKGKKMGKGEDKLITRMISMLEKQNKAILYLSTRLTALERVMLRREQGEQYSVGRRDEKMGENASGLIIADRDQKGDNRIVGNNEGREGDVEGGEVNHSSEEEKRKRVEKEIIDILKGMKDVKEKMYVGEIYERYFKGQMKRYELYNIIREMEKEGYIKAKKEGTKKYVYV